MVFFRFQNWPMVFVASSNHSRFASSANSSMALKNLRAFGLSQRVGIGLLMPCFPRNIKLLFELFQYNLALFVLTRLNPLTEGFTEGFTEGYLLIATSTTTNIVTPISPIYLHNLHFSRAQFMRFELKFSHDTLPTDHIRRLSWLRLAR